MICSSIARQHEQHLKAVFEILRKNRFYLEKEKYDLYGVRLNCLGHIIDEKGIHTDRDKMSQIRSWRTLRNLDKDQRFVDLVEYLAQFMPDASMYTTSLTGIQWKSPIPVERTP